MIEGSVVTISIVRKPKARSLFSHRGRSSTSTQNEALSLTQSDMDCSVTLRTSRWLSCHRTASSSLTSRRRRWIAMRASAMENAIERARPMQKPRRMRGPWLLLGAGSRVVAADSGEVDVDWISGVVSVGSRSTARPLPLREDMTSVTRVARGGTRPVLSLRRCTLITAGVVEKPGNIWIRDP